MSKRTSPWACVGLGCAIVVICIVAVAGSSVYLIHRKVEGFKAELKDPKARAEKAKRFLGTEILPAGYYPAVSLSIPLIMDMVVLTDDPPRADGSPGKGSNSTKGIIYMKLISTGQNVQELEDYFSGKTNDPAVLRRNNITLTNDVSEALGRGVIEMNGEKLLYLAQRGRIEISGSHGDGVNAMVLVVCPGDQRMRFAIWWVPDPAPGQPASSTDFSGTPADENAIRQLMQTWKLCE